MSGQAKGWIRRRPEGKQNLAALGVGLGVGMVVGGVVFYLARLFIARESIEPAPRTRVAAREGSSAATRAR